jgi:hypothetical protein
MQLAGKYQDLRKWSAPEATGGEYPTHQGLNQQLNILKTAAPEEAVQAMITISKIQNAIKIINAENKGTGVTRLSGDAISR